MKISIIVAVYNEEKFLPKCLDSLLSQTLSDIEILCLDDCSTDKSLAVLKSYEKQDSRIKIIEFNKNSGQGVTRNKALDIARGEFIMMVDGDDWLEPNACEKAYKQITQNQNDMVYFACNNYYEDLNKSETSLRNILPFEEEFENPAIRFRKLDVPFIQGGETCFLIYKRAFLNNNNIRYSQDERIGEDLPFLIKAMVCSDTFSVITEALYNRRMHKNSCSFTCINRFEDLFSAREKAFQIITNAEDKECFLKAFYIYYINSILYWYKRYSKVDKSLKKPFYKKMRDKFLKINESFNIELIKDYIKYDKFKEVLEGKKFKIFETSSDEKYLTVTIFGIKIKTSRNHFKTVNLRYKHTIERIKLSAKDKKIRVAFYVNDSKWKCQNLYDLMLKNEHYEPFILVGKNDVKYGHFEYQTKEDILSLYNYYKSQNMEVYSAYDFEKNEYIPLDKFNPDIIFYSRQWKVPKIHNILETSKFALTCYVPYFISNSPLKLEAGSNFHNLLWKYYVINKELKNEYQKVMKNRGKNLEAVGYPELDTYLKPTEYDKKYIIYAPHWSVGGDTPLNYATFEWNNKFILDFAKQHPELNWVFKPHPALKGKLIESGLMSDKEVENYYNQWNLIGQKYEGPDYFELFKQSKVLITDCGSFLAEYMPTKNPVILLKSKSAKSYNFLAKKVTKYYYKASHLKELSAIFDEVILKGEDQLKHKRLKILEHLKLITNASQNIIDNLNKTFEL